MEAIRLPLWEPQEYRFPLAFGFTPNLRAYLHEDDVCRPAVLVVPGGGYAVVASCEAEVVAKEFYHRGYQAFVLIYTTNLRLPVPLNLQPLQDIARSVRMLRSRAEQFKILPKQLAVCGFSAGGHLCADLCVHYSDIPDPSESYFSVSCRPDAALLCYPVISFCQHENRDSITALLGTQPAPESLAYHSAERHVSRDTPPCFLWHTFTDTVVPYQNSVCYAQACAAQGVPVSLHLFSDGPHGLSLASEAWAKGGFPDDVATKEQTFAIIQRIRAGEISVPEAKYRSLTRYDDPEEIKRQWNQLTPNTEASVWPELADAWLKQHLTD